MSDNDFNAGYEKGHEAGYVAGLKTAINALEVIRDYKPTVKSAIKPLVNQAAIQRIIGNLR